LVNFISNSFEETINLGVDIAKCLKPSDVVALIGDLAAGKTTMIKGICRGVNISRQVESPTYTLVNEYSGNIPVYHIDCYRETNINGWLHLGINEYLYGDGISLIEWANHIEELLPESTIFIRFRQEISNENLRYISVQATGEIEDKIKKLQKV